LKTLEALTLLFLLKDKTLLNTLREEHYDLALVDLIGKFFAVISILFHAKEGMKELRITKNYEANVFCEFSLILVSAINVFLYTYYCYLKISQGQTS
jgi:hypothetical protein